MDEISITVTVNGKRKKPIKCNHYILHAYKDDDGSIITEEKKINDMHRAYSANLLNFVVTSSFKLTKLD